LTGCFFGTANQQIEDNTNDGYGWAIFATFAALCTILIFNE